MARNNRNNEQNQQGQQQAQQGPAELLAEQQRQLQEGQDNLDPGSEDQTKDTPSDLTGGEGNDQNLDQGTESLALDALASPNILLVGGFEVSVRLSELLTEAGVDFTVLETTYTEAFRAAVEEDPASVPMELPMDAGNLPFTAIKRYIEEAKAQGLDLANVAFVIADPAKDSTLQSINFMRSMIGQAPTYFYPRLHAVIEE